MSDKQFLKTIYLIHINVVILNRIMQNKILLITNVIYFFTILLKRLTKYCTYCIFTVKVGRSSSDRAIRLGEVNRKMKTTKQDICLILIKSLLISVGLFISGIGMALFYDVQMGSSAMGTFVDGMHYILNVSQGSCNILMNALFLLILVFFARKYISAGTVLCTFTLGLYVNLGAYLIQPLNLLSQALPIRVAAILIGTVLMGIGLGMYVAVDFGLGPLEAIVAILCEKTKYYYKTVKITFDFVLALLGVFLGGKYGIGTLASVFLTGAVMEFVIKKFQKVFKRLYQFNTSANISDRVEKA